MSDLPSQHQQSRSQWSRTAVTSVSAHMHKNKFLPPTCWDMGLHSMTLGLSKCHKLGLALSIAVEFSLIWQFEGLRQESVIITEAYIQLCYVTIFWAAILIRVCGRLRGCCSHHHHFVMSLGGLLSDSTSGQLFVSPSNICLCPLPNDFCSGVAWYLPTGSISDTWD